MSSGATVRGARDQSHYYSRTWSGGDRSPGQLVQTPNAYVLEVLNESRSPDKYGFYNSFSYSPTSQWKPNDDVDFQSKIVQAVKGHQFNLGVAIAEGNKTVSMVTTNLGKIGLSLYHLRHGNVSEAARQLGLTNPKRLMTKDVSSRWLELQYGWRPLLSDVYESARAYHKLTSPPRVASFRVQHSCDMKKFESQSVVWYSLPTGEKYIGVESALFAAGKESLSGRIFLLEQMTAPRSLGLLDPATVAWELVPYSFVVDWFIPIGTYIENLSALPSINATYISSYSKQYTWSSYVFNAAWDARKGSGEFLRAVRSGRQGLPRPTMPGFKSWPQSLSPGHIRNAIALAYSRVGTTKF